MKILITGVKGYIGRHLALQLHTDGHEVFGVARWPLPKDRPYHIVESDLSLVGTSLLPKQIDAVLHLAQGDTSKPDEMFAVNVAATDQLARYATEVGAKLFLFASTGNVYQPSPDWLTEKSPLDEETRDYYTLSKITGERFAWRIRDKVAVQIIRLFTPYGPGQQGRMIPRLIEMVRNGQTIRLTNGGQPHVNPIHIKDLVEILRTLVKRPESAMYNIGGPVRFSVFEICNAIASILVTEARYEDVISSQTTFNLLGESSIVYRAATWTPSPFPHGLEEMIVASSAATV